MNSKSKLKILPVILAVSGLIINPPISFALGEQNGFMRVFPQRAAFTECTMFRIYNVVKETQNIDVQKFFLSDILTKDDLQLRQLIDTLYKQELEKYSLTEEIIPLNFAPGKPWITESEGYRKACQDIYYEILKLKADKNLPFVTNQRDPAGNTILHLAASEGRLDIFQVIKEVISECNISPDIYFYMLTTQNSIGDTPLHIAVQNSGNIDLIRFILSDVLCPDGLPHSGNCAINQKNNFGLTPGELAIKLHSNSHNPSDISNYDAIIKLLYSAPQIISICTKYETLPVELRKVLPDDVKSIISSLTSQSAKIRIGGGYANLMEWAVKYDVKELIEHLQKIGFK